jgi:hypothetical protein
MVKLNRYSKFNIKTIVVRASYPLDMYLITLRSAVSVKILIKSACESVGTIKNACGIAKKH